MMQLSTTIDRLAYRIQDLSTSGHSKRDLVIGKVVNFVLSFNNEPISY